MNYANHGHAFTSEDWTALLDFFDKHLRGKKIDRTFDRFPTEAELDAAVQPVTVNVLPPVRIILVGDSTVAPRNGWGQGFCAGLAPPPPDVASSASAGQANSAVEPQGDPASLFDYTHLEEEGSALFGRMVAGEFIQAVPALRPYVCR